MKKYFVFLSLWPFIFSVIIHFVNYSCTVTKIMCTRLNLVCEALSAICSTSKVQIICEWRTWVKRLVAVVWKAWEIQLCGFLRRIELHLACLLLGNRMCLGHLWSGCLLCLVWISLAKCTVELADEGACLKKIYARVVGLEGTIGNLRTTTKFTTTTSVDRESNGTRTSVAAGNRKLKM